MRGRRRRGRRTSSWGQRIPPKLAREIAARNGVAVGEPVVKKERKKAVPSHLEAKLVEQIRCAQLPAPEREQRLVPGRKFKCDLVWRAAWLVVEVEGGIFGAVRGRHATGAGMTTDAEKYNALTLAGWKVLRVTPPQVRQGLALKWIEQALQNSAETR